MITTSEFIKKSKTLLDLWTLLFIFRFLIGSVLAIIALSFSPESNTWLFEFLSFSKGLKNPSVDQYQFAYAWLGINLILSLLDFCVSYSLLKKSYKYKPKDDEIRIKRIQKDLTWIIVASLFSIFVQIINGVLWWLLAMAILIMKRSFYRDVRKIDIDEWNKDMFLISRFLKFSFRSKSKKSLNFMK